MAQQAARGHQEQRDAEASEPWELRGEGVQEQLELQDEVPREEPGAEESEEEEECS